MGGTKVLGGGGAPIGSIVRSREIKKASEIRYPLTKTTDLIKPYICNGQFAEQ